jgi:hypothetical protein
MSEQRGDLARLIRLHQRALELQGSNCAMIFPEKIGKLYRDAVARLGVAVGDMELYARTLDGIGKAQPTLLGRRKRRDNIPARVPDAAPVASDPFEAYGVNDTIAKRGDAHE